MSDHFNADDRKRTQCACADVLAYLQRKRVVSSGELRAVFEHAAMRRVNELKLGKGPDEIRHPIEVRRIKGAEWEVRYDMQALGRDASTPQAQKRLF